MSGMVAPMQRRRRAVVLGAVFVCLALPPTVALVEAVQYRAANRSTGVIDSSGDRREYLLHVPGSYSDEAPVPLVISMHGGALWPAAQERISGWNRLADEYGFIVVYPAGRGKPKRWGTFVADTDLERDVRFVGDLIDTLRAAYAIDATRIYADGLSNGGGMAFVLSCTLADRVAAIGMVAPAQTLPADWCPDTRPMPMMAFHGDADPILPYGGGPMKGPTPVRPVFAPVRNRMAWWAARNGCGPTPHESTIAADVVRLEYTDCADGAPVVFHRLLDGGHTWPGGSGIPRWFAGPTNRNIDATREMWTFFQRHTLEGR